MRGRGGNVVVAVGVALAMVATVVGGLGGCGSKKPPAIAELVKADGPVEREASGNTVWAGAPVGTKFYLGDAARTADGAAQLTLVGAAQIAMQPHTVLRFGGTAQSAKLSVELGAVDLTSTGAGGSFGLDLGDVKLAQNGSIRITATGQGKSSVQLLAGTAELSQNGSVQQLELGKIVELGLGTVQLTTVDAGVADAPPPADAAVDAGAAGGDQATVDVTGKHAEILPPGETKWAPLAEGQTTLEKGTKLRVGAATTAKLVAKDTSLELGANTRAEVADELIFGLELGAAKATVAANASGKVGVPGGAVELKGTPTGPAIAKIDVAKNGEAKVTMVRGGGKLDGAPGTNLDMALGETASIAKAGTIHPLEAIPNYDDFAVTVGEAGSFTIHDPRGTTALKFNFGGKCPNGGVVELDHSDQFRTAKLSGGKDSANMSIGPGAWAYRLRCTVGDSEGPAVGSGHIVEKRDDGRRPLPPKPGKNPIDADGRNYTISYQSLIPVVEVHYKGSGSSFKLHLATGGVDETFDSDKPVVEIPGTKLREATYTYWFEHDGVKQDKVSTLKINFDQTAPQVYIEAPQNGAPFGVEVDVRGAVLPGWSAKVDAFDIPIDKNTRRFGLGGNGVKVPPPDGKALAIRLAHPKLGVHFYLRRGSNK